MQALSRIAAIAALAANCAYAQPTQTSERPAATAAPAAQGAPALPGPDPAPPALPYPPVPPELAPLSQDFQAAMANSQLQTYRYNQLTEQALALKKLCDTGFGPADICPKAGSPASQSIDGALTSNPIELPTVAEITGARGALSAVLVLADGRHILVRAGAILPDGRHVAAVTEDDVRLSKGPGRDVVLYFGGGQAK